MDPNTLRITGVIDWAWAGWHPRFWDRLVAYRAHLTYGMAQKMGINWKSIFEKVFPLYNEEAIAFDELLDAADEWGEMDLGYDLR